MNKYKWKPNVISTLIILSGLAFFRAQKQMFGIVSRLDQTAETVQDFPQIYRCYKRDHSVILIYALMVFTSFLVVNGKDKKINPDETFSVASEYCLAGWSPGNGHKETHLGKQVR